MRSLQLFALVLPLAAATGSAQSTPLGTVTGEVLDLIPDANGHLLYCTEQGNVGTVDISGTATVIATGAEFIGTPRALAQTVAGDVIVMDHEGNLRRLAGGAGPAQPLYNDLWLITDARDLIVDVNGTFLMTSATPTSGVRGVNYVSANGQDWSYYRVDLGEQPAALAADPITGDLFLTDAAGGGRLKRLDKDLDHHPSSLVDASVPYGFNTQLDDGDMAVELDGDVLSVGAGNLYHHSVSSGVTSILESGLGPVTGIAIAPSSANVTSSTGFSAYLAQGALPTTILEVPNVDAPAGLIAEDVGRVPSRGLQAATFFNINVQELAVDAAGDLLIGGNLWGEKPQVQRIRLPEKSVELLVDDSDGLVEQVEGITVDDDGVIYAASRDGDLHSISGSPPVVTLLFDDPNDDIVRVKDLAFGRGGFHYFGTRTSLGNGRVFELDPAGALTNIMVTTETRGVAVDPFSSRLMVSQWFNTGFNAQMTLLQPTTGATLDMPGFATMNYSNGPGWADGDAVHDVEGYVYNCSEDDFCVYRYHRPSGALSRIGSGYTSHPAGLAIAPSTPAAMSDTGFSLFVAERNTLWEIPNVAAPAPTRLDPGQPPVGRAAGWLHPDRGTPRALAYDPSLGLMMTTSIGNLEGFDPITGQATTLQVSASQRDMVSIDRLSNGHLVVGSRAGEVFDVDPTLSFAVSVVFVDPLDEVGSLRDLVVDGQDAIHLVGTAPGGVAGRLFRLDGGSPTPISYTARGVRAAIDPLTADLFVTEIGANAEGAGEILRVDTSVSPAWHGHYRGDGYQTYGVSAADGSICFDADGNFYVAAGDEGRVYRVDRASGVRTVVGAHYTRPVGLTLAPGTPGTAGALGTSLFVIDGQTVYEVGVDGLPAGVPPATPPALASPADLQVQGDVALGTTVPVRITSQADALRVYAILPTVSGKSPGLPLAVFGDLSDPRVIPSNPDTFWNLMGDPGLFPGFIGVLDANGETPAGVGMTIPLTTNLAGLGINLDLTWVAVDPFAQSGFATVGGTAQLYLGE